MNATGERNGRCSRADSGLRRALDGCRDLLASVIPAAAVEGPHAQFGEDQILAEVFVGSAAGSCVEVGAFDGVTGSTTLAFERRGWRCLLVEPNPESAAAIRRNRPRAILAQCAASSARGTAALELGDSGQTSSLIRGDGDLTRRRVQVDTAPLDELLRAAGFDDVDFLTIDVEGHELEALSGLDLDAFRPRVIIVEANRNRAASPVSRHLASRGYVNFRRTGVNDWYARTDDPELTNPRALARFRRQKRLLRVTEPLVPAVVRWTPARLRRALRTAARGDLAGDPAEPR